MKRDKEAVNRYTGMMSKKNPMPEGMTWNQVTAAFEELTASDIPEVALAAQEQLHTMEAFTPSDVNEPIDVLELYGFRESYMSLLGMQEGH